MFKKKNNFLDDYLSTFKKKSREEEIKQYNKPLYWGKIKESKKKYKRNKKWYDRIND